MLDENKSLLPAPRPTENTPKCEVERGAGAFFSESPRAAFQRMIRLTVADGAASDRTVQAYTKALEHYFTYTNRNNIRVVEATLDDIEAYRAELACNYKRGTIKLYLRAVRLLYAALQRFGKRKDNPAATLRPPKDRTSEAENVRQKALSPKEAGCFYHSLPDGQTPAGARDRCMVLFMLLNGLRAGEVSALTLDDIEESLTTARVNGKGSKWRTIRLAQEVRAALIRWLAFRGGRSPGNNPLFYRLEIEGHLFPATYALTVRTVERIADKYLNFAGLKRPGRSAHALRHTYAMLAVLGGAEREQIGVSMGHANLATTDIYIRAASEFQANPAKAVSKLLEKENGNG